MVNDFLTEPRPERYTKMDMTPVVSDSRFSLENPTLTVGLARITENRQGLKIIPQTLPTFGFGYGDGFAEKFDLPVPWVRDLAKRLLEWCDLAEEMNKNDHIKT